MHLYNSSPVGISDIAARKDFLTLTSSNPYPITVTPLLEISAFTDNSFIPSSQVSRGLDNKVISSSSIQPHSLFKDDQDPFILLTKKAKNNLEQLSEPPPPSMNQNNPIPLFLVNGNLPGSTPIYASLALPPFVLTSLLEMRLQSQSPTFSVLMDNKKVIFLIQRPSLLAQLVSDGMRTVMEAYNNHLWMMSVIHVPMNYQALTMPFFHISTWETPIPPP
ncbi:hypothetical protein KY284_008205 [Solanum tuberosum]|nr:hypothetical protein KY284_008205 [Solanum tuberosum]